MKIIILTLSVHDGGVYSKFLEMQKNTWDSIYDEDVDTFYFFGNDTSCYIKNNEIYTDEPESYHNCTMKTIKSFELLRDFDFDYIFRTNSSSYVDKKLLKEYLKDKPRNNFYSAIIGNHDGIPFGSGCGYFLSRDLVHFLIDHKNEFDLTLIDDVSVGKLLSKYNIELVNSSRFDVINHNDSIPLDYFHYRLNTNYRDMDISNMKKIFDLKCK